MSVDLQKMSLTNGSNGSPNKSEDEDAQDYPRAPQVEYSSTAPDTTPQNGGPKAAGEAVPSHLYERLPANMMKDNGPGQPKTPDYLRMILLSKVYSEPLNLKETPLTLAVNLSARLGNEIWLKREDLQPVFSFKVRGAYNLMANLSQEDKWKGVITCSAGNHAQGVALAGFSLKVPCTIVMPLATPSIKWRNVERLGAKVVLHGQDFDEAKAECNRLAKLYGLLFVPPFDDPFVIAGQGTVAMELARQVKDFDGLDGVFSSVGGGGLLAGMASYIKRLAPDSVKVIGVEPNDGPSMKESLDAGHRVTLKEVGLFSDGTAVKIVGEESFRICKDLVDDVVLVSNDQICAAIKDIFEETRSVPEPAGALALAGLKAHITRNNLIGAGKRYVAIVSGANMNFGRLRFVAERAELGERKEVLMGVRIPESSGSFIKLHQTLGSRVTTEFAYRYSSPKHAVVIISFLLLCSSSSARGPSPEERSEEVKGLVQALQENGMEAIDMSDDELAKSHLRHMNGGKVDVPNERMFRFEFPERPGALRRFLLTLQSDFNRLRTASASTNLQSDFNISLFHYRDLGSDNARVAVGIQVPPGTEEAFDKFLQKLGYGYVEESENPTYKMFLKG